MLVGEDCTGDRSVSVLVNVNNDLCIDDGSGLAALQKHDTKWLGVQFLLAELKCVWVHIIAKVIGTCSFSWFSTRGKISLCKSGLIRAFSAG